MVKRIPTPVLDDYRGVDLDVEEYEDFDMFAEPSKPGPKKRVKQEMREPKNLSKKAVMEIPKPSAVKVGKSVVRRMS